MPQLQALAGVPSFGSQLGQGLGQNIGAGISGYLGQMLQNKQNKSALSGLQPFLKQAGFEPKEIDQFINSGIDPKIAAAAIKTSSMIQAKNQQSEDLKRIGQDSLNRINELVEKGNVGFGSKVGAFFGGETAKDVGEFESLTGALEAMLVDKVSRGTLSNARFKYITETLLPKPTDRENTIRGKIKALSRELDLDLPEGSKESSAKPFGGGKIKITDPKTKQSFYPSSMEDVKEAKAAGWKVTGG